MTKTYTEIELPLEALRLAATMRYRFPGLTDPEIVIALVERGLEVKERERRAGGIPPHQATTILCRGVMAWVSFSNSGRFYR